MKIWSQLASCASLMRKWAMPCLYPINGSLLNILIRRWSNWVSSSKHCKTFWQVEVKCLELLRKSFGWVAWGVPPWVTLMPEHFTCGTITFPVHRAPPHKLLWISSSRLIAFPPMWRGWHPHEKIVVKSGTSWIFENFLAFSEWLRPCPRSFFFVILCPSVHGVDGRSLNYSTWEARGWCRLEYMARQLAREDGSIICIKTPHHQALAVDLHGVLKAAVFWCLKLGTALKKFTGPWKLWQPTVWNSLFNYLIFWGQAVGFQECIPMNHLRASWGAICDSGWRDVRIKFGHGYLVRPDGIKRNSFFNIIREVKINMKSYYFNIQVVFGKKSRWWFQLMHSQIWLWWWILNDLCIFLVWGWPTSVGRHPALVSSALRGTEQKWGEWCSKWFLVRNGKSNSQGGLP